MEQDTITLNSGPSACWAALREHRPNDNPVSVVMAELPKRRTAVKHHAALHYSEVAAALRRIASGTSFGYSGPQSGARMVRVGGECTPVGLR